MAVRIAFMGFRQEHFHSMYRFATEDGGKRCNVVATCEEDPQIRQEISAKYPISHDNYQRMLDTVPCDAVEVVDYFGKRGAIVIEALRRGKHVLSDKPICTTAKEFQTIQELVRQKKLVLTIALDLRDKGTFQRMRQLVQEGAIGEVHGISVGGQHPLLIGIRPAWYFEEGKHGGSINDLSIHAFDVIRWITGMDFVEITAARSWNAFAKDFPHFHDGAQFMARMENGCGVLGDVSYFMPDSQGRVIDQYWRLTMYGTKGVIETSYPRDTVWMARRDRNEPEIFQPLESTPGGYLQSFIREINGDRQNLSPSSADSMRAASLALVAQQAAYDGLCHVKV